MPFSRNPVTGNIESYTENGFFMGYVSTMGDFISQEFAEDGGPGSGNWGHKGRPGLVGGSGKGGGSQYRGGRSDVGYFSSRKDWLNGLQGEEQHDATRYFAEMKRKQNGAKAAAEHFKSKYMQGYLTLAEYEEQLERLGLKGFNENDSPETYIMKHGEPEDKSKLISYMQKARNWQKNKDRLIKENLSDDEKKIFDYLNENMLSDDEVTRKEKIEVRNELLAKALGVEIEAKPSDELLYATGLKERPKTSNADYSWYRMNSRGGGNASNMEPYMQMAMGETPRWGNSFNEKEFGELNQKFVDKMKYNIGGQTDVKYAVRAIGGMRNLITSKVRNYMITYEDFDYKKAFQKLSDDEKSRLLELANKYGDYSDLEKLDQNEFQEIEWNMRRSQPRKNSDRRDIQDYVLLQEKMLCGAVPSKEDPFKFEAEQKAKAEAERKRIEAEKAAQERAEAEKNWKSTHTEEDIKKMYHPESVAGVSRGKEMNTDDADNLHANPERATQPRGRRGNCQTCVVAYEMRRRGYDVIAKMRYGDAETLQSEIARHEGCAWIDPETGLQPERKHPPETKKMNYKTTAQWIDDNVKEGERHTLSVCWKSGGAHIISFEKNNGVLQLVDPQSGERQTGDGIAEYMRSVIMNPNSKGNPYAWTPELMRVDNALPNPKYYDKILMPSNYNQLTQTPNGE